MPIERSGGGTGIPTGPAGGDLAGTFPNPNVAAIHETSGPTQLTIGAITDGQFLKRVGATLVSALAPVTSVFGRTGDVVATSGDYTAALVTNAADKASASSQSFTGAVLSSSTIRSSGATLPVGYAVGAGGAVTQTTNRATGVTINTPCGAITTNTANLLNSAAVVFTVTCSSCSASADVVLVTLRSNVAANAITYGVQNVTNGSFDIWYFNNSGASTTTAFVFNYAVFNVVTS